MYAPSAEFAIGRAWREYYSTDLQRPHSQSPRDDLTPAPSPQRQSRAPLTPPPPDPHKALSTVEVQPDQAQPAIPQHKDLEILPIELRESGETAQCHYFKIMYALALDPLGVVRLGNDGFFRSLTADPDPLGFVRLGNDSFFRSLTADPHVVVALGLEPRLIEAELEMSDYDAERERLFRGVDGTKVPRELWFKPDDDILPPPLDAELFGESKPMLKQAGPSLDLVAPREQKPRSCLATVIADHEIEV